MSDPMRYVSRRVIFVVLNALVIGFFAVPACCGDSGSILVLALNAGSLAINGLALREEILWQVEYARRLETVAFAQGVKHGPVP